MVAALALVGVHYTDRQWFEALRWRLGFQPCTDGAVCRNESYSGEKCGASLDKSGNHCVDCAFGPLRNRRHDDLADVYADVLEEAGGIARREVYVHELSGAEEAWLDVWSFGVHELGDVLLDVTVRHPGAERYQPSAAREAGFTAQKAGGEKFDRYPAANGRSIWPISHETWGRLGDHAEELLSVCAAAASRRAARRGRVAGGILRRWRAQLDARLHRAVAAQLAAARLGLPGRARRRVSPLDINFLEARCPL